jgi:hypothetical protein
MKFIQYFRRKAGMFIIPSGFFAGLLVMVLVNNYGLKSVFYNSDGILVRSYSIEKYKPQKFMTVERDGKLVLMLSEKNNECIYVDAIHELPSSKNIGIVHVGIHNKKIDGGLVKLENDSYLLGYDYSKDRGVYQISYGIDPNSYGIDLKGGQNEIYKFCDKKNGVQRIVCEAEK